MSHQSDPQYLGASITGITSNNNGGFGFGPLSGVYNFDVTPAAASVVNLATAQQLVAAGNLTLTAGTGVTSVTRADGTVVYQFDTPRAVALASAADLSLINFTISGYDIYGQAMTQTRAGPNNNTVNTTKAFYQIVTIAADAAVSSDVTAGGSSILGLPIFLANVGNVISVRWNSTLAQDAGTFVAGVTTTPSATTGDVRGTYLPSSAADASKRLIMNLIESPSMITGSRDGLLGKTQA